VDRRPQHARHLTTALLERGVRVLVTSRRGDPQAELLPCEITDGAAVRRLTEEDPTLDVHRDPQTGEQIIAGLRKIPGVHEVQRLQKI